MGAAKLLELITIELKLAHTLLELPDADQGDPTDPESAARVINHADAALEAVRSFMPKARLSATERAYIESELEYLAREVQAHRRGERVSKKRK